MDFVSFAEDTVGHMARMMRNPTGCVDAQPDGPEQDVPRGRRTCQLHGGPLPCVTCRQLVEGRR